MPEEVINIKDTLGVTHSIVRKTGNNNNNADPNRYYYVNPLEQQQQQNGTANGEDTTITSVTTTLDPWSQIAIMFISTLSFIAAFSWNGAVNSLLDQKVGTPRDYKIHFIYALCVTGVAALAIYYIVQYTEKWLNTESEIKESVVSKEDSTSSNQDDSPHQVPGGMPEGGFQEQDGF